VSEILRGNYNEEQLTQEEDELEQEDEYEPQENESGRFLQVKRKTCVDFELKKFLKNNYVVDENSLISKEEILKDFGKNVNRIRFGGTVKSVFGNITKCKMINQKVQVVYTLRKINNYCETCGQHSKDAHKPSGKEIPCPSCGNALREIGRMNEY
jgi:ribosomal protein S27E